MYYSIRCIFQGVPLMNFDFWPSLISYNNLLQSSACFIETEGAWWLVIFWSPLKYASSRPLSHHLPCQCKSSNTGKAGHIHLKQGNNGLEMKGFSLLCKNLVKWAMLP